MTDFAPSDASTPGRLASARRRFLAALGLFLAWVVFLIVLGMLSATGPDRRIPPAAVERPNP
jgi:hypothetical protein